MTYGIFWVMTQSQHADIGWAHEMMLIFVVENIASVGAAAVYWKGLGARSRGGQAYPTAFQGLLLPNFHQMCVMQPLHCPVHRIRVLPFWDVYSVFQNRVLFYSQSTSS